MQTLCEEECLNFFEGDIFILEQKLALRRQGFLQLCVFPKGVNLGYNVNKDKETTVYAKTWNEILAEQKRET